MLISLSLSRKWFLPILRRLLQSPPDFAVMQLLVNSDSVDAGGGGPKEAAEQQLGGVAAGSSPASSPAGEGVSAGGSPGSGGTNLREKPAKVIPCPRCESMNTKFCYFNNYSVKQPRYFCRQCQRYWTVGGTLRNVPVGGGSRKKSRNQRSEPYLRSAGATQCVVSAPLGSGALSSSGSPLLQTMGFQQMLMQDVNLPYMVGYQLQEQQHYQQLEQHQNPGLFYPVMNKACMSPQEVSAMHAMYASRGGDNLGAAAQSPNPMLNVNGSYHSTPNNMEFIQGDSMGQMNTQWGNSMPEHFQTQSIWNESTTHQSGSPGHNASDEEHNISNTHAKLYVKAEGYEPSNMLLHFGLNNKPALEPASLTLNGSSPPHGSSTIEEEGSTPTNGYSTNGYEDGDAVSSMWPDLEFFH